VSEKKPEGGNPIMPELPDVEIFKQYLESTALKKEIEKVEVPGRELLENVSVSAVKKALQGEHFSSARRHGKYLFIQAGKGRWLVLHFGMTGFLKYFKRDDIRPGHAKLLIHFTNGFQLALDNQRKFGKITLSEDPASFIEERELGPDALQVDPAYFRKKFGTSRARLKPALMNQKYLAGIGNVYSDEILFQAGLHPGTSSRDLDEGDMKKLLDQTGRVLEEAIEARADPGRMPASFIIPHRHGDGQCPGCGGALRKERIGGRTAFYCPQCQRKK